MTVTTWETSQRHYGSATQAEVHKNKGFGITLKLSGALRVNFWFCFFFSSLFLTWLLDTKPQMVQIDLRRIGSLFRQQEFHCIVFFHYFESFQCDVTFVFLFCLTQTLWHSLSDMESRSQLHSCLKDSPFKLFVRTLWLSQWVIIKWHPCIFLSSAWHSESSHKRHWSAGG